MNKEIRFVFFWFSYMVAIWFGLDIAPIATCAFTMIVLAAQSYIYVRAIKRLEAKK